MGGAPDEPEQDEEAGVGFGDQLQGLYELNPRLGMGTVDHAQPSADAVEFSSSFGVHVASRQVAARR